MSESSKTGMLSKMSTVDKKNTDIANWYVNKGRHKLSMLA